MDTKAALSLAARNAGGALLCLGVTAVHIEDQGGVSALADPAWIGWGYRLTEAGGLVVALALMFCAGARLVDLRARLVWLAAALVGLGPLVGYVLTRTTGLPGDSDDVGNWGEPTGIASLVIEGLLIVLAVAAVAALRSGAVSRASGRDRRAPLERRGSVPTAG